MKSNDIIYSIIIIISLTANFWTRVLDNTSVRYLQYIGLVAGLLFCCIYGFKKMYIVPSYIKGYILLIVYSIVSCISYTPNKMAYIIFWSSAVLMFLPYNKFKINFKIINVIFFVLQFSLISSLHIDLSIMAFLKSSTSSAEINAPAFIFPLFFVYFLHKNDKLMLILNIIGIIVFAKRIVIISVVVVLVLYFARKYLYKNKRIIINPLLFVGANIAFLYLTILFARGEYDYYLQNNTSLSIGELSMGRNTLYRIVGTDFLKSDLIQYLFGHGTASVLSLLSSFKIGDLHNDILKIAYEYGMIVFFVFFYLLYRNVRSWASLSLVVMSNIFLFTDNALIYSPVITTFFLIYQELDNSETVELTEPKSIIHGI